MVRADAEPGEKMLHYQAPMPKSQSNQPWRPLAPLQADFL